MTRESERRNCNEQPPEGITIALRGLLLLVEEENITLVTCFFLFEIN